MPPPPTAVRAGTLATFDLADLIQELHQQRWTGRLELTRRGGQRRLLVHEGRLVFARSTDPDDRLGELLRGRLSLRQFREASSGVGPGRRLGTVLVEQGVLAPKELVRAVVEHAQEIIYGSFQWTEGQYGLVEAAPTAEDITLNLSTPDLILEGLRRVESWSRIERALGGAEALYGRTDEWEGVAGQMALSFEKLELLTGLHTPEPVERLCTESSLPDIDVCRTLWAFRVVGAVRRLDTPKPQPLADEEGLGSVLDED
jgi:Domain of unknown function (DUF4388)